MKVFYTLRQLESILDRKRNALIHYLDSNNIPYSLSGNKYIVYLSDIETSCPQLFNSIQLQETYQNIGK
jgi:hypothetical protein